MWTNKYEKLEQIGRGGSGSIFKVKRKDTKQLFAAKVIKLPQHHDDLGQIEQQIKYLSQIQHPNIVKCHGIQLYQKQVWIIMHLCEGSLFDIMYRNAITFSEEQISICMRQIIEALIYLHQLGIVHRDIKASNILVNQDKVYLSDFGVACKQNNQRNHSKLQKVGSPFWISPQAASDSIYTSKTDIWSLGITAIQLAQGNPPLAHQHPLRAVHSIQARALQGLVNPSLWSSQFNEFVKLCLATNYKSRPSAKDLLTHPFITKYSQQICEQLNDTLIMHEEIPKSMWQKQSFPQSQHKESNQHDTVIIKENISNQNLLCNVELRNVTKCKGKQQQRDKIVKKLFTQMQVQIKNIRNKYMQKIRHVYSKGVNHQWQSPLQKLKNKKSTFLAQSVRINSFTRKIL